MKRHFKVLCLLCLSMFVCMLAFAGGEEAEEKVVPEEKVEAPVAPKEGPFKFVASNSEAQILCRVLHSHKCYSILCQTEHHSSVHSISPARTF